MFRRLEGFRRILPGSGNGKPDVMFPGFIVFVPVFVGLRGVNTPYPLRPGALADTLEPLVEACRQAIVRGPSGCAKSRVARRVAADAGREYIDVRALLPDPVDLHRRHPLGVGQ